MVKMKENYLSHSKRKPPLEQLNSLYYVLQTTTRLLSSLHYVLHNVAKKW